MSKQIGWSIMAAAMAGASMLGCAKEYTPTQEITTVREATPEEAAAKETSTADRLRVAEMPTAASGVTPPAAPAAMPSAEEPPAFTWTVPPGWEEAPATAMRVANLRMKEHPEVEMYFSVLSGDGGGLVENLNRWYGQMGAAPLTPEQVEALPGKPFLFKVGKYVDVAGTFKGMGGEAKDNYRLIGLALVSEGQAYFVKLTGPADIVEGQSSAFTLFYQSILSKDIDPNTAMPIAASEAPAPMPAEAPVTPETPSAPAASEAPAGGEIPLAGDMQWDTPPGWEQAPDRAMRVVTFTVNGAECYISVLGGAAGGIVANIGRWYGQMGQDAPDAAAIDALEKVEVFGAPCALINIEGTYQGMGGAPEPGYRMLGVARESPSQSVFVKMVGPSDVVSAEADNFRAFVQSLR